MSKNEQVEVASEGRSYTVVGGGDGGPWWVKYSMQAGFMFILILVLWGVYDLFKTKLPALVEPVDEIAQSVLEVKNQTIASTAAQVKQAEALANIALAQSISSDAAKTQADAIERWVNMQNLYRVTSTNHPVFGPPESTHQP